MEQHTSDDQTILKIASLARTFAMKIVDDAAAEDITQDVALQCLIKIRAGAWRVGAEALPRFVRRVVRRKAVDLLRRSRARARRHAEYALETQATPAWMSPELAYEERELLEFHGQALERLPKACRRAYLMVRAEDETYQSAALRLGVQRETVHTHVKTAQQRLRRELTTRGISAPARSSRQVRRRRRRFRRRTRETVETRRR